jgi:hypothetical protein
MVATVACLTHKRNAKFVLVRHRVSRTADGSQGLRPSVLGRISVARADQIRSQVTWRDTQRIEHAQVRKGARGAELVDRRR